MCSSAAWPSGFRKRWGGSRGRVHRLPEGGARHSARGSCRALGVSQSWFYKWLQHSASGTLPARAERRQRLAAEVARLFGLHDGKRGSPRITADLRDAGWRVSENTVARLMREQHLAARRKKRRRRSTTRPGKGRWRAPDLVKRDFPARRSTASGSATVRRSQPMRASCSWSRSWMGPPAGSWGLPCRAPRRATAPTARWPWRWRCAAARCPGCIFHTDQGSEYTAGRSGRPASGWASPSPWAGPGRPWTTRSSNPGTPPWSSSSGRWSTSPPGHAARAKVAAWIEDYNTHRRHSACQMMSPVNYEKTLAA